MNKWIAYENCFRCRDAYPTHFSWRVCSSCCAELASFLASEEDIRDFCWQPMDDEEDADE